MAVKRFSSYGGRVAAVKSKTLAAVKREGTKPELLLFKVLSKLLLPFSTHVKSLPGKPDAVFEEQKIAIFCDGDFWHGRDWERRRLTLKVRREYWINKIEGNMGRDRRNTKSLADAGWTVLRFWESQIIHNSSEILETVKAALLIDLKNSISSGESNA